MNKKLIYGGIAVVVALLVGLVIWLASSNQTKNTHKATCWGLVYARNHNPKHLVPAPRHGKGALATAPLLCYTQSER